MVDTLAQRRLFSGCRDSNPESPVPKTGMLAVTPHPGTVQVFMNSIGDFLFFLLKLLVCRSTKLLE